MRFVLRPAGIQIDITRLANEMYVHLNLEILLFRLNIELRDVQEL